MSLTDQMTGESIFTEVVGICLLKCKEDQKCLGMVYGIQNKRCFMKQCVNPHLFTEWNEKNETFYIFISHKANMILNTRLARGNKATSLWSMLKKTIFFTSETQFKANNNNNIAGNLSPFYTFY